MNVHAFVKQVAGLLTVAVVALPVVAMSPAADAEAAPRRYHPTVAVSSVHAHTGDQVKISGKVKLYRGSKRTVVVQYRYSNSKTWHTLRTVKTSKSGKFTTTFRFSNDRDRVFRVKKSDSRARTGYSKTVSVIVDPVMTTRTTKVPFTVVAQPNAALNMCTRNVLTAGVNGTVTYTLFDGKVDLSRTVTVAPVNEVDEVGTSSAPCLTGFTAKKAVAGSSVSAVITGHNLSAASAVTFAGQDGSVTSATDTSVAVTGPSLTAGDAAVVLTVDGTTLAAGTLKVVDKPAVTSLSSTSGSLSGGEKVTVTGVTLGTTSSVTFTALGTDTVPLTGMPAIAATYKVLSDTTVSVTVPAGLGGDTAVKLVTDYGTVSASYTYSAVARTGSSFERQILSEINKHRAAGATCGTSVRSPAALLTWDGKLSDLASSHARDIVYRYDLYGSTYSSFTGWHGTPGLPYMAYRFALGGFDMDRAGEILAATGASSSASYVVDGWMASPGHCLAIMNPSFTSAGAGAAVHSADGTLISLVDFQ